MAEPEQPAWVATWAFGRAVVVVGVLILLAALSGRVDLVVLAAPFALGTALSLRRRPSTVPRVTLAQADPFVAEGAEIGAAVTVTNPDPVGLDLALVRVHMSPWLRVRHGDRPYAAAVPAGKSTLIALEGPAVRWGRHALAPAGGGWRAGRGAPVQPRRPAAPHRLAGHPAHPAAARGGHAVRPGRRGGPAARRAVRSRALRWHRGRGLGAGHDGTGGGGHRRTLPAPWRPGVLAGVRLPRAPAASGERAPAVPEGPGMAARRARQRRGVRAERRRLRHPPAVSQRARGRAHAAAGPALGRDDRAPCAVGPVRRGG